MVAILMMSANLATLGLLEIKVFWNKGYGVIIFVHDVTNKILSRDSNHIEVVIMSLKFGDYVISMWEVIVTSILKILTRKTNFFKGCSCFKFNKLGLALGMAFKKVLGADSYVSRSYRWKTGRRDLFCPSSSIGLIVAIID